jgi:hypothetical protein
MNEHHRGGRRFYEELEPDHEERSFPRRERDDEWSYGYRGQSRRGGPDAPWREERRYGYERGPASDIGRGSRFDPEGYPWSGGSEPDLERFGYGGFDEYGYRAQTRARRGAEGRWPGDRAGRDRIGTGYGPFAGRGPKGYQRSAERILDDVCERLTDHPEIDASAVEVDVLEDLVVLRGTVHDRGQKRIAEDVAESVAGVRDVRNELDIEKGILQSLTDAVTGRSDDDEVGDRHAPPRKTRA